MAKYLLLESRDPFEGNPASLQYGLALDLARNGDAVTLFLVANGVLAARAGARANEFIDLERAGVEILADEFSLRERAISAADLAAGVRAAPLSVAVDQIAEGRKALWH